MNPARARVLSLFVTSLFFATVLEASIAPRIQPAGAHSANNYVSLFDFETGLQGWGFPSGGITGVEWTSEQAKNGRHSMKMTVNLLNGAPGFPNGEAYVDLGAPRDFAGKTISAWVYAPPGARGSGTLPNGLHLFLEDLGGRRLYGTWQNFLEGGWSQVTIIDASTKPACGDINPGFNPSLIRKIGLNVAIPSGSSATFSGPIYLDKVEFGTPPAPTSTHFYDFADSGVLNRRPTWGLVPNWGDLGLQPPTWQNGALAMAAHFTLDSEPAKKGAVGIIFSPSVDLAHKSDAVISADFRFEPSAMTVNNCPFVASIWAYDDNKKKWFTSDDINVGAGEWTRISFDLADVVQYKPGIQDYTGDTATLDAIRQVVFQFFANAPYDGQLLVDNVAVGGLEVAHPSRNQGFVQAQNGQFVLNGRPFRFVGANAEYLFTERSRAVVEVLDRAASMGTSVVRTWGFSEGCEDLTLANCTVWSRRFQSAPGQWNETAFEQLDQIIAMAAERGLRLVIPLANNWGEYGGRPQYVAWLQQVYPGDIPPGVQPGTAAFDDLFYTNPHIKQWYKDSVTHLIGRINGITGIRYSQDPTIFAWELINEPRAPSDVSGATLHQWLVEMSEFVDGLDPNHMIGTGEEGWYVMPKASADSRARLSNGTVWQNLPGNYWEYGVNWKPQGQPAWSSDGVDFISDHSSTDTQVCWQAYAGDSEQAPVQCQSRKGVPKIDFASIHLYIDAGASSLYLAPYCAAGFDSKICNANYDRSFHQAFLWIAGHSNDALSLGKPLIVGEFGFRSSGTGGISSGAQPRHVPPFEPYHRAQLYLWYLGEIYRQGIGGALFWNMGVRGYPENLWDGADALASSGTPIWRYNFLSDASSIALCPGPDHVTQGRYSVCANYDSGKGYGKAFVDRINLSAPDKDWSAPGRSRFRVDVYTSSSLPVIVGLVTGSSQTWYESLPQATKPGWNIITVDTTEAVWKSAATGGQYNSVVNDPGDVRQVSVGVTQYTVPGTFYIDNLRHVGDDGLVLYPGDPALGAIRQAICENWRSCIYLPIIAKP